jgi:hypothetical protein
MNVTEIENELTTLSRKMDNEPLTKEEEKRFVSLYKKYVTIIDDKINIERIKKQL